MKYVTNTNNPLTITDAFGSTFVTLPCPLADCSNAVATQAKINAIGGQGCKKKKQEKTMFYDTDTGEYFEQTGTETERTKDFLVKRLQTEFDNKDRALKRAFFIVDDEPPTTSSELVKRILDGKYILEEKTKDTYSGSYAACYVVWRDPSKPADKEGYNAAYSKLEVAFYNAKDEIKVLAPEKGLESLKAFQAATFA